MVQKSLTQREICNTKKIMLGEIEIIRKELDKLEKNLRGRSKNFAYESVKEIEHWGDILLNDSAIMAHLEWRKEEEDSE